MGVLRGDNSRLRTKPWFTSLLERMDEFFAQTRIIEINSFKAVLKEYMRESGVIKWFLIKTAGLTTKVYPYTMDPVDRMKREISFMEKESRDIVKKPRILIKDWVGKSIIREYIEGEHFKPDDLSAYKDIAYIIASLHREGYVLGDTKFYNFIRSDTGYYIIDAEQAIKTSDPSYMYWDIMVFLLTTTYSLIEKYFFDAVNIVKESYNKFLQSYLEADYDHSYRVLSMYNKFNYRTLAYLLFPLPYNIYYIKAIETLI